MRYATKNKAEKQIGIYPRKCKQCGEPFECRKEYGWKINVKKDGEEGYYFCKYSCMRAYETGKKEKKEAKKNKKTPRDIKVLELLQAGYNQSETSRIVGMSYQQVRRIREKWWEEMEA